MDDLISRQDAIKAVEDLHDCYNGFSDTYDKACIIGLLEELPSAQKTGKWKHDGSQWENRWVCGCGYKLFFKPTNYCPNCGARMESDAE